MFNKFFCGLLMSLLLVVSSFAQKKNDSEYSGFFDTYYFKGPWNFTLGGGIAQYNGDIKNSKIGNTFGVGASYKFWPRTYFGGQFNYISFSATDSDKIRNISFSTTMMEVYGFMRFNVLDKKMLKNRDIFQKEMRVRPYVQIGLGVNRFKAVSETDNPDWKAPNKTEDVSYPKIGFAVPVGAGVAVFVTHRISVLGEFNLRLPLTDYLDDVSARGFGKKDSYFTAELKIQYSPFAPKMKKKMKFKSNPEPGPPAPPRPPKVETPANETPPVPEPDPYAPTEPKPEEKQDEIWGTPEEKPKEAPKADPNKKVEDPWY